jgi:polygalacturonase
MMRLSVIVCFVLLSLAVKGADINILSTGAIADGKTINTIAIQKAIDDCYQSGGGKVVVPGGIFITGQLQLRPGIELHLQANAVLKGSTSMGDYPNGSFISAKGCNDIQFTGMGTLDGSGAAFYDGNFQPLKRPQPFILLDSCHFIRIRDIKIINSPSHTFRIINCSEVVVDGIYMNHPERSPNTDGIDIVDSRNVYISNSTFITGDDAICIKSHAARVQNVTVTNCTIVSDDAGIKLGTGSKDTIEHCTFSNIVIRNTRFALAMFMQEGGVYRFISFNNINIQNGGRNKNVYPIYIDVDKKTADGKLGLVEFISFSNLQIETRGNILIEGQPAAPLQNITLSNIRMLVNNCDDVTNYKKPRGNRNLPVFADTKDLSTIPAHITLGYIQNLRLRDIDIVDRCTAHKRKLFHKQQVTELK